MEAAKKASRMPVKEEKSEASAGVAHGRKSISDCLDNTNLGPGSACHLSVCLSTGSVLQPDQGSGRDRRPSRSGQIEGTSEDPTALSHFKRERLRKPLVSGFRGGRPSARRSTRTSRNVLVRSTLRSHGKPPGASGSSCSAGTARVCTASSAIWV